MKKTQSYISENKEKFLNELVEWLKIPSISADLNYKEDVKKAAEFAVENFKTIGISEVTLHETAGHPIIVAKKEINPDLPTVLVYGHYDVQPPDPIDLWESPPFEPVIKETELHPQGAIFARGSCDDKGQAFMHVKAVEAMIANDELPCNVKFILEGEEEVGSVNLYKFLEENKELLACDVVLISDTGIIANDTPSLTVGLRGLSYVEVKVIGPNRDLHSGLYGGAVANPLNILCQMVAKLTDDSGRITIPGFYDNVVEFSNQDRIELNKAPFDPEAYMEDLGVNGITGGEIAYSPLERTSIRPTLDLNGIWGGYIGEGAKTVLPSYAEAKISMRLVPNQKHEEITQMFEDYFKSLAPKGVTVEVNPHHGGPPAALETNSIEYKAASNAMRTSFGKKPIPVHSGGSIPIVAFIEEQLQSKCVLMGFGLASDRIHSPNEHYGLFNFYKGIETIPHFYKEFVKLKKEA